MYKLAVFVSGRGSNLSAILSEIHKGNLKAEVSAVVSNKSDCGAIESAKKENIPTFVVGKSFENGEIDYSTLSEKLQNFSIDLIVLAGFLKKIPADFINSFKQKIINIHPALLPSFGGKGMYGINVHRAVFESSAKISGPTVHFVDEIYDNGKIINQQSVDISDVKTPEEIAERVLKLEHKILPDTIKLFTENKIKLDNNRVTIN